MKTNILIVAGAVIAAGFTDATEVNAEAQRLIGLETADLAAKSLPPQVAAYGSVLSPAPLIDLFRQIEAAKAAAEISKQTSDRAEKLFSSGELVARKDLEAAQAQLMRDQVAIQVIEDRLILEWGPSFSKLLTPERTRLREDLLNGKTAIVRLSVARSEMLNSAPLTASLHAFGQELKPIRATSITPATMLDPAFQARGFLCLIETSDVPLAIGLTLTGTLELTGEPRAGVVVPPSAVVYCLGKTWIYQKAETDEFERIEIPTDTPADGGWFLASGVLAPHPVVTHGAQSILSQETSSKEEK